MRILHTMLRTGDLDRSIAFYTEILGMRLLRRKDYPDGKFTLAFVGYGDESDNSVIELTYNWGSIATTWGPATATSLSRSTMCMRQRTRSASVVAGSCAMPGR